MSCELGSTQVFCWHSNPATRASLLAAVLGLVMMLSGCGPGAVARRAQEIRDRNAQNNRESGALAARLVREQWLVREGKWFGKKADGSLVRLAAPTITATALKQGRPYCCKWLGEITVSDRPVLGGTRDDAAPTFCLTYTVLVRDSDRIEILRTSGPTVTRPDPGEIIKQAPAL